MTVPPSPSFPQPSTWFSWHAHRIRTGMRVLDVAAGSGRHGVLAATLGGTVTLLDRDETALAAGRALAAGFGVSIESRVADLTKPWPDLGVFDAILVFNYLDRSRMGDLVARLAPGGLLLMETFLDAQREQGWGPEKPEHLLKPGELARLVAPLEILHGREVLEPVDATRWRAIASIAAQKLTTS